LKDIEFGSPAKKLDGICRIHLMGPAVDLQVVQPLLEKTLNAAPDRSLLKFYCVSALAALGDGSDLVADALISFMSAPVFEDPTRGDYDKIIRFPWVTDVSSAFHRDAYGAARVRNYSTQVAVIEAFGQLRENARAAEALISLLGHLQDTDWRLFTIYASGANGHPSLRQPLEYLRDREPGSLEAGAAKIALEHFGTAGFLEIGKLHGALNPHGEIRQPKSGCFIATAVYGSPDCREVALLRQFRDDVLLSTQLGRLGVDTYYHISPPIADVVSGSERLKFFVRNTILRPAIWCAKRVLK
jgi:hypothetical protein